MNADGDDREVVVCGIVIPVSWDAVGNPLRVAILTVDEGEYQIAPRGLGRRLFRFLREEVKARLVLGPEPDGPGDARLVSFTIIQRGNRGKAGQSLRWNSAPYSIGEAADETVEVCDEL